MQIVITMLNKTFKWIYFYQTYYLDSIDVELKNIFIPFELSKLGWIYQPEKINFVLISKFLKN